MAKLKATPKSYAEAAELLAGRDSIRLGNNTYLENFHLGIAVRLHNTRIVVFHEDGRVTLHTGGYHTVTTKERLNQFIKGRVYQKSHAWFYVVNRGELGIDWANPIPFEDGIDVSPRGLRLGYLRGELKAERISYAELAELQSLASYIEPGDTELLEAAGVSK